jgi:glycosyltransferase involved in cell wall biosynthesis
MLKHILVIATSRNTRGGITSVVKSHEQGVQWKKYNCKWIETHIDKNNTIKFLYFIKGFVQFLFLLPSSNLIHIHTSEPSSAKRKLAFILFSKLFRKKLIVHFHSYSPDTTINGKYKNLYHYIFKKADCIIVLSKFWKKAIRDTYSSIRKIKVLHNPCARVNSNNLFPKKHQILFAGTIIPRKGYGDLIKAFSHISKKYPNWKIVFAGNGEIEKGLHLAKMLKVEKNTIFLGWVNCEAKEKAFCETSIFCLPSYAEGFPMAVLDAWSYALPVICTPVGGLPDIVQDGVNALLFNCGDIWKLAEQIEKLISDEHLRKDISLRSKDLALTVFDAEVINNQLGEIYEGLLRNAETL